MRWIIIWKKGVDVSMFPKSDARVIATPQTKRQNSRGAVLTAFSIKPNEYLQGGGGLPLEDAVDRQARSRWLHKGGSRHHLIFHAANPPEHRVLLHVKS
jgi:hypothetical protein